MVKTRDINMIRHSKSYKIKYANKKKIVDINSIDTETYNGYAYLILYTQKDKQYYNHINTFNDIIRFIFRLDYKSIYTFYNLDYDIGAFLKFLDNCFEAETYKNLLFNIFRGYKIVINPVNIKSNKIKNYYCYYSDKIKFRNITIFYIRDKQFRISNLHKTYNFYDMAQFYKPYGLDMASLMNLNRCEKCNSNIFIELKKKYEFEQLLDNSYIQNGNLVECRKCRGLHKIIRKIYIKDGEYNDYDNLFKKDFIDYGKQDVILTQKLSKNIYSMLQNFNLFTNKLISQAYLSKMYYFKNEISLSQCSLIFKRKLSNSLLL